MQVWIDGATWQSPQAYVHELGHNVFLQHALVGSSSDWSDDMAPTSATFARCFNPPHNFQVCFLGGGLRV